jgi:septal ring factor EnvC (AmiA/AmiB activator)
MFSCEHLDGFYKCIVVSDGIDCPLCEAQKRVVRQEDQARVLVKEAKELEERVEQLAADLGAREDLVAELRRKVEDLEAALALAVDADAEED